MIRDLLEKTALDIALSDMENIGNYYDLECETMSASNEDLINFICEYVYEIIN